MKLYLLVFNDGDEFRIDRGFVNGGSAEDDRRLLNGWDRDSREEYFGPYEVQTVEVPGIERIKKTAEPKDAPTKEVEGNQSEEMKFSGLLL